MLDDETGEALYQQLDDTADALKNRLTAYTEQTLPILDHYRPGGIVLQINANQAMDSVWGELLGALSNRKA